MKVITLLTIFILTTLSPVIAAETFQPPANPQPENSKGAVR